MRFRRRSRGKREPSFWDRQRFDIVDETLTTPTSLGFFVPGATNTFSVDSRVTVLRIHATILITSSVDTLITTGATHRFNLGVCVNQFGATSPNPHMLASADVQADWMWVGSSIVQMFNQATTGNRVNAPAFQSGSPSGGGATLELDIKTKRKLTDAQNLEFNCFPAADSGAATLPVYSIHAVFSTLYQRTLR